MMKQFSILFAVILIFSGCEDEGITDKSERSEDERFLEQLREEIMNLSESEPCEDAENWAFTALGSKACGGPAGYIAYPTTINVEDFLDQVEFYTAQQKIYNEKWGIMSTCDIPPEPSDVICEDGKPVLIYSE